MNRCPTMPVAPRMPTLRRSISTKDNAPPLHRHSQNILTLVFASAPSSHLVTAATPDQDRDYQMDQKPQGQSLVHVDQVEHQDSRQKEPEERRNDAIQMKRQQYPLQP